MPKTCPLCRITYARTTILVLLGILLLSTSTLIAIQAFGLANRRMEFGALYLALLSLMLLT